MSDSRRLTSHPSNCKLRLDFLADCRANGMDEHRVQQRYATTEHLIRQAGDKELCEYNIGELKQLLADAQALSSNRVGKPLSHERLRKVFLHARELLTYAREVHPTRFKQHPRHLKNLQIPLPADGVSTERRPYYTLSEMQQIAEADFGDDWVLRRAQAMACLQFDSGMRGGALVTLPLQALDLTALTVRQDPRMGVKTKFRKTATTALLGIPELVKPVREWYEYLAGQVSQQAMVYSVFDDHTVPAQPTDQLPGKGRIKNLNDDYAKLCAALGLPYRSSHAFRHGHILFCVARCETPVEFLAVSQNVMHADVKMTAHYGAQDLKAIHSVYAGLTGKDKHARSHNGGDTKIEIEAAVSALTSAAKSDQISPEQRALIRELGIEIFTRLTQR